jgi:hypothetical protein
MENKKERNQIVKLTFKAVGMAMAIATLVLNILGTATIETRLVMLTIGLLGLAVAAL